MFNSKIYNHKLLHETPIQCSLEVYAFYFLKNVFSQQNFNQYERRAKILVIVFDLILLIVQNKDTDHFKHRLYRHMILGIIIELITNTNKALFVCRLIHHLLTMYITYSVEDTNLVRNCIQVVELANLFTIPVLYQQITTDLNIRNNKELSLTFNRNRYVSQVIARLYVFIMGILSFGTEHNYQTEHYVIFLVLQLISLQEIYFSRYNYKSTMIKNELC